MLSLLGSLVVLAVVVALALAWLAALTAVPFVVAVDMAERRGFSTTRWGVVALALVGLGGALGALPLVLHDATSLIWLLVAPLVSWAPVVLLALLGSHQSAVGGVQGAHER